MDGNIGRLPDGELEIMQAIWDCPPPVSRSDIERLITAKHPLAATTILTLLSRLTQRGALRMEKRGRGNVYTPAFSRQEYVATQSGRFFSTLCQGDIRLFAAALCDSGLSEEDIAELRLLLEGGQL